MRLAQRQSGHGNPAMSHHFGMDVPKPLQDRALFCAVSRLVNVKGRAVSAIAKTGWIKN